MPFVKEEDEEEDGQIVSLDDSRIKRVWDSSMHMYIFLCLYVLLYISSICLDL